MSDSPKLRLAVFDCDGTLVDSQHLIVAAVEAVWRDRGLTPPPPAAVRRVIGLPLGQALAVLLGAGTEAEVAGLVATYKEAFRDLSARTSGDAPLYPGALEALDALEAADVLLGIATGKSRRGLDRTLDRHGLADRFVTLQTADDGPGKPHPHMLLRAIAEAGVEAADTAMIGDTTFDMEMAGGAGTRAVGVAWGYHESAELTAAGAETVVERFADLPAAVGRLLSPGAGAAP